MAPAVRVRHGAHELVGARACAAGPRVRGLQQVQGLRGSPEALPTLQQRLLTREMDGNGPFQGPKSTSFNVLSVFFAPSCWPMARTEWPHPHRWVASATPWQLEISLCNQKQRQNMAEPEDAWLTSWKISLIWFETGHFRHVLACYSSAKPLGGQGKSPRSLAAMP